MDSGDSGDSVEQAFQMVQDAVEAFRKIYKHKDQKDQKDQKTQDENGGGGGGAKEDPEHPEQPEHPEHPEQPEEDPKEIQELFRYAPVSAVYVVDKLKKETRFVGGYYETSAKLNDKWVYLRTDQSFAMYFQDAAWRIAPTEMVQLILLGEPTPGMCEVAVSNSRNILDTIPWKTIQGSIFVHNNSPARIFGAGDQSGLYEFHGRRTIGTRIVPIMKHHTKNFFLTYLHTSKRWALSKNAFTDDAFYMTGSPIGKHNPWTWKKYDEQIKQWRPYRVFVMPGFTFSNDKNFELQTSTRNGFPWYKQIQSEGQDVMTFDVIANKWQIGMSYAVHQGFDMENFDVWN